MTRQFKMTLTLWNATLKAAGINVKLSCPVRQPSAPSGPLAVRHAAYLNAVFVREPIMEVDWMLCEMDMSLQGGTAEF